MTINDIQNYIPLLIIAIIILWLIFSSIVVVRQKTLLIIELFGRFNSIKTPGLKLKIPAPFATVAGVINLKIQEVKAKIDVKTRDNAFLKFPVAVQFRVIESKAKEAFYELQDPVEQMSSYILNLIRSRAASLDMNELYTNKDEISNYVEAELKDELSKFGYEIVRVLIDQPEPSKEVADSFNRVIASQREKEAAQAQADALKVKLIGEAQAEAESLKLKAQAYVEQRKTLANGISDAMAELRTGLVDVSDHQILDYFAGIDYRDTIREASKNPSAVIITPLQSTATMNDVAVTAKLVEKTLKK